MATYWEIIKSALNDDDYDYYDDDNNNNNNNSIHYIY
jgi:hypothetical protein